MDRATDKQARIDRRRKGISSRYPAIWEKLVGEWNSPGREDLAWLIYSANYLFRTAGIHWALDPLTLHWRVPGAPPVDTARDLRNLSFVLLTHCHADHLDFDLLRSLRTSPIRWVIPESILSRVQKEGGLPEENIIVAVHLKVLEMNGIRITPFDGQHFQNDSSHPNGLRGVPEKGYLVEFSGKRWLFPGDTRTYDANQMPSFGPVDGLFAHLWLGRGCALNDKPPLLDAYCNFHSDLQAKQIIVTHLEEFGRAVDEFWDAEHFQLVKKGLLERSPGVIVKSAYLGQRIEL